MRNDIRGEIKSVLSEDELRIWDKIFPFFEKANEGTYLFLIENKYIFSGHIMNLWKELDESEDDLIRAMHTFIEQGMVACVKLGYNQIYAMNPYLVQGYADDIMFDHTKWIKYWDGVKPRDYTIVVESIINA